MDFRKISNEGLNDLCSIYQIDTVFISAKGKTGELIRLSREDFIETQASSYLYFIHRPIDRPTSIFIDKIIINENGKAK